MYLRSMSLYQVSGSIIMADKNTSIPSLKELCLLGNYVEIVMLDTANDIDIADRVFSKILMSIKKTHSGCFQKHYKEFVFRNLFYENNEQNQIKTYKKTLKYVGNMDDGMKIMVYHKEKLPYHSFPCTTKLHSICYISKAVLKINNRVFLNFEKRVYPVEGAEVTQEKRMSYNKIYINYNGSQDVDVEEIDKVIRSCIQLIN